MSYVKVEEQGKKSALLHQESCSFEIKDDNSSAITKLTWVLLLAFFFMVCEAVGGWLANSLAILADAAHLFSDFAGYAISLVAVCCATRKPTQNMSFGYARIEILGALLSVMMLWVVLCFLIQEGIERLQKPEKINGFVMLIVSSIGLVVNLMMGCILTYCGHGHSHGLRKCNHAHAAHGDTECHGHSHAPVLTESSSDQGHGHHGKPCHGHGKSNSHGRSHNGKPCDGHEKSSSHGHGHGKSKSHGHGHGKSKSHGHSHDGKPCNVHGKHAHVDPSVISQDYNIQSSPAPVRVINYQDSHDSFLVSEAYERDSRVNVTEHENMNVRAAFVHVVADTLQSLGVVVSSALIYVGGEKFNIVDPICTLLFSVIGFLFSLTVLRDIFQILMLRSPKEIDTQQIQREILDLDARIHSFECFHLWNITPDKIMLSCHIRTSDPELCSRKFLKQIESITEAYGIMHSTVQINTSSSSRHVSSVVPVASLPTESRTKSEGTHSEHLV